MMPIADALSLMISFATLVIAIVALSQQQKSSPTLRLKISGRLLFLLVTIRTLILLF
jgi:hypothetical protein